MSGLLADLYSAGDRMKRKLGGLLSDPMGTIALGSTRMAEDTNALTRLVSEAGYMPNTVNRSDQSVLVSERQKALARALLADKGAEMGMAAATVWHGSPHKFDKFDSSKIGTGEGAQAYGHGLYLAENPGVAKTYTTAGTDAATKRSYQFTDPLQRAAATVEKAGGDVSFAIRRLASDAERGDAVAAEAIKALQSGAKLPDMGLSNLYKVDLPDNAIARMLDWDKPLSQQAPEVQQILQDVANKLPAPVKNISKKNRSGIAAASDALNGGDAYFNLGGYNHASQTSQLLREAGIPGIRYLDGGSRGAGQGSSNFVVFPGQEDILTILERNGVPIK